MLNVLCIVLAVVFVSVPSSAFAGGGVNCGFGDFEGTGNTLRVFPTYAVRTADGVVIPLRVWVHEREDDRLRRKAIDVLRKQLGVEEGSAEHAIFRRRMLDLMVDNESGEKVYAKVLGEGVLGKEQLVGETGDDGHVFATLRVSHTPQKAGSALRLRVRVGEDPYGEKSIEVPIVPAQGLTIVSDIDDTIKITNVVDKKEMFANTMLRDFREAPGMAAPFAKWAEQGATFHYVSASPWSLQHDLADFAKASGFPSGVYHLRVLRPADLTATYDFAKTSAPHKIATIETLFQQFPQRSFILVGDTGEKDPEVYADLARRFPERVQHMYLRHVDGADNTPQRFTKAFTGVPRAKWTVFTDPAVLIAPSPSVMLDAGACTSDADCTTTRIGSNCCPGCGHRAVSKAELARLNGVCARKDLQCPTQRLCQAPKPVTPACIDGTCRARVK